MAEKQYDIFITHAWRYHDDWTRLCELLDQCPTIAWRNFSVPWFDPVMDPNTEAGMQMVHRWLETQIMPAAVVVLLTSVYAVKSARKWVDLEVAMARRHSKPIVGLPVFGETEVPADIRSMVSATVPWEATALAEAFEQVLQPR